MIKKEIYPEYKIETIGVSGKKNTDKHLFSELLQNYLEKTTRRSVVKTGFSAPLYQTLIDLFSPKLTWEHLQNKEVPVPGLEVGGKPVTGRMLVQSLGDYCKSIYPNVLIDRVFKHRIFEYLYIIHDVRFPEEAKAIIEHDGLLIRIEKDDDGSDTHITETALDGFDFPIVVNYGTRLHMQQAVEKIVQSIKV